MNRSQAMRWKEPLESAIWTEQAEPLKLLGRVLQAGFAGALSVILGELSDESLALARAERRGQLCELVCR